MKPQEKIIKIIKKERDKYDQDDMIKYEALNDLLEIIKKELDKL